MKYKIKKAYRTTARRPPRRGAWIEMRWALEKFIAQGVAPRAGGRGLKSRVNQLIDYALKSPPAQGGVD